MKKILTGVIAAAALLFGFASCSGDLHDAEIINLSNYGIRGTMTGWDANDDVALANNNDGTYSVSFTATGDSDSFAVLEMGDTSWNTAYRLAQPKSEGDTVNTFNATNGMEQKVYKGQSANCCTIEGLVKGDKVDLLITPSTTYITVKVTITSGGGAADPVPYYFDGMYLVGDNFTVGSMTNLWSFGADNLIYGASVSKTTGVVTYTKDIVATDTTTQMGINDSSWGNKQLGEGISIKVGDELTKLDGTEGNFNVTNLKGNTPYRVTITTTPEKVVSVKVEEICSYTLTFEITGLSEGNAAWINGQFWGSSWPNGWPMTAWDSPMNTTLAANIPEATDTGVATFNDKWNVKGVAKPGETLSWKFKPVATTASTTWNTDGANVLGPEGDLTCEISNIEGGKYKVSINASTEAVSVTKI